MSRISNHHKALNEQGEGKCSVPMFSFGGPAGFCDEPAFGERPDSPKVMNYCTGEMVRDDGRYGGYVPGLACLNHGGPNVRTFMDGDAWCAAHPDFENVQESPRAFAATKDAAIDALRRLPK